MVLSRLLVATPYNGSIVTVRTPAPRDHSPHSFDTACPERPKPAPLSPARAARPDGKDCMEGDDGAPKVPTSKAVCESRVG
eukprot:scaffold37812_cov67-Phaeocystis_antarctica.AAC.3